MNWWWIFRKSVWPESERKWCIKEEKICSPSFLALSWVCPPAPSTDVKAVALKSHQRQQRRQKEDKTEINFLVRNCQQNLRCLDLLMFLSKRQAMLLILWSRSTGLFLGIKLFIVNPIYHRFPKVTCLFCFCFFLFRVRSFGLFRNRIFPCCFGN